jgi:predicted ATP-grasp superfamily ATP-dependent carboligase
VQGAGHQRTSGARVAGSSQIQSVSHSARHVEARLRREPAQRLDRFQIRPLATADTSQVHHDDVAGPDLELLEKRRLPQQNVAPVVDRQHCVRASCEQLFGARRRQRFRGKHRRCALTEGRQFGDGAEGGIDPQRQPRSNTAHRINGERLSRSAAQRIQVRHIQVSEREELKQRGYHILDARRIAKPGANRLIMRAIAEACVHNQPAHHVDHRYNFVGPVGGSGVRVHVFEFICGGGLAGLPLPPPMAREGDLMLTALIADLLDLPELRVTFARDARLGLPAGGLRGAQVLWRAPQVPPMEALATEIDSSDAVWPIAPETGGELERVARAVQTAGRMLLGPDPDAIALAGSKLATAQCLTRAGIDVVPCFRPGSTWPAIAGPWVAKPDDGAGSLGIRVYSNREEAATAAGMAQDLIGQPWMDGEAMSLCVLGARGSVEVLSVNRQLLQIHDGTVELAAIEVNCEPVTGPLAKLAQRVGAAIPGLRGFFGIDLVRAAGRVRVIEINPRLTTSYAGLRAALGMNVAERVLAAATGGLRGSKRTHPGRAVRLMLNGNGFE